MYGDSNRGTDLKKLPCSAHNRQLWGYLYDSHVLNVLLFGQLSAHAPCTAVEQNCMYAVLYVTVGGVVGCCTHNRVRYISSTITAKSCVY